MNENIETPQRILAPFHPTASASQASGAGRELSAVVKAVSVLPVVFEFRDFRLFLASWFQAKKLAQPNYSGAIFAKRAGFNSHTLLGMVIRGQRNLSATSIRSFCRALGLGGPEATYFEKLVLFNQARNEEDRAYYLMLLEQAARVDFQARVLRLVIASADLPRILERIEEFRAKLQAEFSTVAGEKNQVIGLSTEVFAMSERE